MQVPLPVLNKPIISIELKLPAPEPAKERTYIIVSGDTLTSISEAQGSTVARLWAKNTELTSPDLLEPGKPLKIPQNNEILPERPMPSTIQTSTQVGAVVRTDKPSSGGLSVSGNLYSPGYCTWYVKNMRPELPNNLGNADTWFSQAAADGLRVGYTPSVGAVAVAIGYMHVALVTGVHDNSVDITEMNYAGWYVVSSRTAPISEFRYIY